MSKPEIDVVSLTASNARALLEEGTITSVDLVKLYLAQIAKHNHQGARLNAIISTAPRSKVLELARQLDQERAERKIRGPLHGIPVIVKVLHSSRRWSLLLKG
jgi:amidase